jgi:hypothetical protein
MLEPRVLPAAAAVPPTMPASSGVAVQISGQPTRKVAAATNYGSTAGGLIAGAMTLYGDGAIREVLALVPLIGPKMTDLLVFLAVGAAVLFGSKVAGRIAAYDVLDAPNVAMAPVTSPTAADIRAA